MGDFELIVIDDGSNDGTSDTLKTFAALDQRVRHFRFEENVGLPALTSAKAFLEAKGEYLAWQFDDCEWYPHLLTTLVDAARTHGKPGLFYGQADMLMGENSIVMGERLDRASLKHRNPIPNVATLTHRSVFDQIGWFDPHVLVKRINDYDFWVRLSDKFDAVFVKEPLAKENGGNLSDSLGNSVSLFSDLSERYMSHQRNDYLSLKNIDAWNPYRPPEWLSADDISRFYYILFEHFIRIKKPDDGANILCSYISLCRDDCSKNEKISHAVRWYAEKTKSIYVQNDPIFIGYQRYVINILRIHGAKGIFYIAKAALRVLKRMMKIN